jgi:hypothetical protein
MGGQAEWEIELDHGLLAQVRDRHGDEGDKAFV